ncbi:MAG: hypothetical protein JSS51_15335 [Planctomycetes bacterium]|nr:hypothetical protein [Planctomycetota bacterium]
MRASTFSVYAAAGITSSALASFGFSYEFSTDGGVTFNNTAVTDATSGPVDVQFRVVAYATPGSNVTTTNGSGAVVAFARLTGSERFNNFGASAGDSISEMTRGQMSSGNAAYFTTSLNGANTILGTTAVTSFASKLWLPNQLAAFCPTSGGTPDLAWVVRTGTLTFGPTIGHRIVTFQNNTRSQSYWYHDYFFNGAQDVTWAAPDGVASDFNGTLLVIPTPGSIAVIAGATLLVFCRRRAA